MKPAATVANCLWAASNLPSLVRFRRALKTPAEIQQRLLCRCLSQNADCAYGRVFHFEDIRTYEQFVERVPIVDYDDIESWIDRIRRGESNILTSEPVSHLIPTSGSSGARKFIPFTAGLQRQLNRAIEPWMADVAKQQPGVLFGPAYWSITPPIRAADAEVSSIPLGFADDAEYLGGIKSWLARHAMVALDESDRPYDEEGFKFAMLSCLLKEDELRLISVWHPSLLTLLLQALPALWKKLLADIRKVDKRRSCELEGADPTRPNTLWPYLRVISCWGDAAAARAVDDLRRRFPGVLVQPKGLLATEAFVSIPFQSAHPIAICSHFFEFIDEEGHIHLAHHLRELQTYEVVVTTAGGLWRYRLRDCVQVTGFVGATPSLRFLGRKGNVSDMFGEKLSEAFVAQAVNETLTQCGISPSFALLAPDQDAEGSRYTLYLEGPPRSLLAETLDTALRQNPHYSQCRDLGQLQPVRVFNISERGYQTFVKRQMEQGCKLGDIKPASLSRLQGWSQLFSGTYIQPHVSEVNG